MFRCDPMSYSEIFLQPEAAFAAMTILGDMGKIQFTDMNAEVPPYLKNYISEVCRCAELERKLRYIESEILKDHIDIPEPTELPQPLEPSEMGLFEHLVDKWETDIIELASNEADLKQDLLELKEMRYLLANMEEMLGDTNLGWQSALEKYKLGAGDLTSGSRLYVMTGIVRRNRSFPFQLMLWRISRGNIYYRQANYDEVLEDPYTGGEIRKVAFVLLCHGETLASRIEKVFSGFKVNSYPCPDSAEERFAVLSQVENRIGDLEEVVEKARYYRCRSMRLVSRQWKQCMIQVRKAKAIYHALNQFSMDITRESLIGLGWAPTKDLQAIQDALRSVSDDAESSVPSFITIVDAPSEPPTCQRTNKFTYGFQMLINAYGDSKYGEINPGLYTIITFPFLFAVMFGDVGHAVIMTSFAIWMLIYEKEFMNQSGSEIWNIFFGGRYVILLLGIFSVVTGAINNEIFGCAFNIGESMWSYSSVRELTIASVDFSAINRVRTPYPYGLDPIWMMASNGIMIDNSTEMKMSIIIGVFHMLFGIILSLLNHIHFKKYYAILLEFLPKMLFLSCMFLWLVFLIFYKWIMFCDGHENVRYGSSCAPQILILFIDMVLYSATDKKPPEEGCALYLFDSQGGIQTILVTIALLMVPILLFGTPVYLAWRNKKERSKIMTQLTQFRKYQADEEQNETQMRLRDQLEKHSESFAELMIHQAVETIEFVLSTISHTASYLRLWALSLAHVQLSHMLWGMVLSAMGIQQQSYPMCFFMLFFTFMIWAGFSLSILILMEGLSAFLHTLRLHWVEFMSKFFIGEGIPFNPFYFKTILASDIKAEAACAALAKKTRKRRTAEV